MSKRAWHPSVAPIIPVQSIPHLENYKFTPAQQGCIEKFLTKYLWNVIAKALPPYVHPNVVTFLGFFFMTFAFVVSGLLVAGFFDRKPGCIYFTLAFCVFFYLVCDGVDGIVARKLGVSSPLGQFFDHGFDVFYTLAWPIFLLVIFECDFNVFFHLLVFGIFIQITLVMVKEQVDGVFYSNNTVFGVTHAHILTIFGLLLRGFNGANWAAALLKNTFLGGFLYKSFLAKVFPQHWAVYHLLLFLITLTFYVTMLVDIVNAVRFIKQKVVLAKAMGATLLHFLFVYAVHCYKPLPKGGLFSKPTLPFKLKLLMYAFTVLVFITIAFNNLIHLISKVPMIPVFVHLAPVYLFLFLYYLKYVVGVAIPKVDLLLVAHDKLFLVFAVLAVYCSLYLIHHFVCVVLEIKHHLGLSIFYVKSRVTSARKF